MAELTKIISNPSKDTVCSPKGGLYSNLKFIVSDDLL